MTECYKVYGKSTIVFLSLEMYFYRVVHELIFFSNIENILLERIQKQPPEVFYKKCCPYKFCNIYKKTPVFESQACNLIKMRLQ